MKHTPVMTALFACGVLACASASAQDSPWSVRLGAAHIGFDTQADVFLGGALVPGGNAKAKSNTTVGLEIGYSISPEWTGRLLVGLPPTTTLTGKGTLAVGGELGKATYGPAVLSLTYGVGQWGSIKPYVGAGIVYNIVFKTKDRFITDFDAKNTFGTALQVGIEVPLEGGWSIGLDARKIFLKTKASGTVPAFGGAPVNADIKLNPLVIFASVGKRF
jgi:outer membrane protein